MLLEFGEILINNGVFFLIQHSQEDVFGNRRRKSNFNNELKQMTTIKLQIILR